MLTGCGAKPDPQPAPAPNVELKPEPKPLPPAPKDREPGPPIVDAGPPLTPADAAKLEALQKAGAGVHGPEDDGGYVVRIEQDTKLESALASLRGLKRVTNLTFDNGELTDDALAVLEGLENLNALVLLQCKQVTGTGFAVLPKLTRLKTFNVVGPLTDAACPHIAGVKSLQEVRLVGTKVTDAGLRELRELPLLDTLGLEGTPIDGSGLGQPGWPKLRELDAPNTLLGSRGLGEVAKLPAIEIVRLGSAPVTDGALHGLRYTKTLTELHLSGTKVTDTEMRELGGLDKLRVLDVSNTVVQGDGFDRLPTSLRKLVLDGSKFDNRGAKHLARLTELVTLSAAGCPVSDAGLVALKSSTKLTKVTLADTKAGDATARLLGALPLLEIAGFDRTPLTDAGLRELARAPRLRFVEARGTKVTKPGAAEAVRFGTPGLRVEAE